MLQSIVEVARSLFAAEAASILLLDEEANELVFDAVAGKGSRELLGDRFPAGEGVAGWDGHGSTASDPRRRQRRPPLLT